MALANAFVAYEAGARSFDGSVGGIGGGIAMPVHTTDMGNVATEDLAFLFESCGVETGIDLPAIAALGREMERRIGTGRSAASSFGTLEDFLAANRERLQVVSEARRETRAEEQKRDDDSQESAAQVIYRMLRDQIVQGTYSPSRVCVNRSWR
jgi:hypothetical protein